MLMLPADRWTEKRPTKDFYALDYPPSTGRWHYIDDIDAAVRRSIERLEAVTVEWKKEAEEKELAKTQSKYGPN